MPDATPNQTGVRSALEASPGALASTYLVMLLQGTRWEINASQAVALVGLASIVSSYLFGLYRPSPGTKANPPTPKETP